MSDPELGDVERAFGEAVGRLGPVTLTGVGFSSTPELNHVTFAGVSGDVVEASETRLVVAPSACYLPPPLVALVEEQTLATIIRRNTAIGEELAEDLWHAAH